MKGPNGWVDYWDGLDARHLLFAPEAEEYVRNLAAAVDLGADWRVLDFGCGGGSVAALIAGRVAEVALWDAAPAMLQRAAERLADWPNVRTVEPTDRAEQGRFDLVLVNSVVQYLRPDEFAGWLGRWSSLLALGGQIIISDILDPQKGLWRDLASLAGFGLRRGYLRQAVRGVLAERGRYRAAVARQPLYRPGRAEVADRASVAGLETRFLGRNLTHFAARTTAILTIAENKT